MLEEKIEVTMRSIMFRESELEDYFVLSHLGIERSLPIKYRQSVDMLMYSKKVFYIETYTELTADPNHLVTFYSWE